MFMSIMDRDINNEILKLLRNHPEGLTITDMSNLLRVNYMTVSKYLTVLEALKKIEYKKIGMAKLFKVKK